MYGSSQVLLLQNSVNMSWVVIAKTPDSPRDLLLDILHYSELGPGHLDTQIALDLQEDQVSKSPWKPTDRSYKNLRTALRKIPFIFSKKLRVLLGTGLIYSGSMFADQAVFVYTSPSIFSGDHNGLSYTSLAAGSFVIGGLAFLKPGRLLDFWITKIGKFKNFSTQPFSSQSSLISESQSASSSFSLILTSDVERFSAYLQNSSDWSLLND